MVIYEVNLDINNEIFDQFKAWLIKHVNEMIKFSGFIEAKILLENTGSKEKKNVTCCYLLDSQKSLESYLTQHAPAMRQDGINKFGNKFSATRRVFEVLKIITPSTEKSDLSEHILKECGGLL
jgi:antibiotic biosynthesis monooxygenase (ABM) superfamily enzyme